MEIEHLIDIHPGAKCDNGCNHCPFNGYDHGSSDIEISIQETFSMIQRLLLATKEKISLGLVTALGSQRAISSFSSLLSYHTLPLISRLFVTFGPILPAHIDNMGITIRNVEERLVRVLDDLFVNHDIKGLEIDINFNPSSIILTEEEVSFMNKFLERYRGFIKRKNIGLGLLRMTNDTIPLDQIPTKSKLDPEYWLFREYRWDKMKIEIAKMPDLIEYVIQYAMVWIDGENNKLGITRRLTGQIILNDIDTARTYLNASQGKLSLYPHGCCLFHGASTVHNPFLRVSHERLIEKLRQAILNNKKLLWVCYQLLDENIENYLVNGNRHSDEQIALLPKNFFKQSRT